MKRKMTIKIIAITLIIIIFSAISCQLNVQANSQSTNNIEENILLNDTKEIKDESDLKDIKNSDKNFILTNDIEITENWTPISNFKGTLDGSGHTITYNISENTGPFPQTQYLGLFDSCTDATIKNLHVEGHISLTTGSSMSNPNVYVGGITATSINSKLENVYFSGNINIVTSNDNSCYIGGLIGKATDNTKISLSYNNAQITSEIQSIIGNTKVGGLCGEFSGTIEDCYNTGNVIATAANGSPYAGGLVGNSNGTITESYNSGKVQANGTSMSLSDVYAGGIVAVGENGSSVTKCAVMSPEISVTIGWVNSGYKYIISKGGTKSDNISINNIAGSPTNDSNARYTEAELKTTEPYDLSFYNTWAINENINNGYPYHERNAYANKYISYQLIPDDLKIFVDNGYINVEDFKQTDDGFTLCTKPLSEIFLAMGIKKIKADGTIEVNEDKEDGEEALDLKDLDSWYIYTVDNSCSILKMRGLETGPNKRSMGTSIPFMAFDIDLINLFYADVIQETEYSENEVELYDKLNSLIYGVVNPYYIYSIIITDYFSDTSSKGNYLIAEEYIRKVLDTEMDSEGYIQVPDNIGIVQKGFLESLPNIYDAELNKIKVNKYKLTMYEKQAIIACRLGDLSFNIYAAENIAHAMATELFGDFLQGTEILLTFEIIDPETQEAVLVEVGRKPAESWFQSAIKSDAGIGEEKIPKELIPYYILKPKLIATFGDI